MRKKVLEVLSKRKNWVRGRKRKDQSGVGILSFDPDTMTEESFESFLNALHEMKRGCYGSPEDFRTLIMENAVLELGPIKTDGKYKLPAQDLEYSIAVNCGLGRFYVDREMIDHFELSLPDLIRAAKENMIAGARLQTTFETLKMLKDHLGDTADIDLEKFEDDGPTMITITNESGVRGATLLPDILKKAAEMLGENVITILPSSIHEVLAVKTDGFVPNDMIKQINETELEPEDVLSDHAYVYDAYLNETRRLL